MNTETLLSYELWGISAENMGLFLLFTLGSYALIYFFFEKGISRLQNLAEQTEQHWDNLLVDFIKKLRFPSFIIITGIFATIFLPLPESWDPVIRHFFLLLAIVYAGIFGNRVIDFAGETLDKKMGKGLGGKGFPIFRKLAKFILWVLIFLLILQNMGVNVSALVASLGVGSIAIALASKNVLGDVFASISISLDQPFKIGDYIEVGSITGNVENVGIKSTRVRRLTGEEVSIPNAKLMNAEIHNYARLHHRRDNIAVGVEYDTPKEVLKRIPEMLKEIARAEQGVEFIRCHFTKFGDSSLNFDLVIKSLSKDYNELLSRKESIMYKIFDQFSKEGIAFAFPSQTVYLRKES